MIYKKPTKQLFSLATIAVAATFMLQTAARSDTVESTEIMACGPLFSIDANADHKTAAERARIVQRNLDNALIAAKDRSPAAVRVVHENHNPVVTLDHYYIVTADNNSAVRAGMSRDDLAEKWADSIRVCLSDTAMVDRYISSLTGQYKSKEKISTALPRTDIAVLPWGLNLPVAMRNDLEVAKAQLGSPISVALTADVPLGPGFATYLPAGTIALGEMVDGYPNNPNNYAGHHVLMPHFFALQTPDGAQIPISGHIYGGVNSWRAASIAPLRAASDKREVAEMITDVNQGPSGNGTGGSKVEAYVQTTKLTKSTRAFPGVIAGAWRGLDEDSMVQAGFPKLLFSRHNPLFLPKGERLTLQLSATSTVAVNSAAEPSAHIAVTNASMGM